MSRTELLKKILDEHPELVDYAFHLIISMELKRISETVERWSSLA